MKKFGIFTSLFLVLFLGIVGCGGGGGGSSSSDRSYSWTDGSNRAALGPLSGATVKIYRLNDWSNPVETIRTNALGEFTVKLSELNENEFVLVEVSGGYDVDANDDGILDENPVENKSTLYAIAKVADLKNGKVNVTVLSDSIFRFLSRMKSFFENELIAPQDLERILNLLAAPMVGDGSVNNTYDKILSFIPVKPVDWESEVPKGMRKIMPALYHKNNIARIEQVVNFYYRKYGFSVGTFPFERIRRYLKVDLVYNATEVNVGKNCSGAVVTATSGFFVERGSNCTFNANLTNTSLKLLGWMGCDEISQNGTECTIKNLNEDKIVAPIIVGPMSLREDTIVVDLTGSFVYFPNYNDTESNDLSYTQFLNSTALDTVQVIPDNSTIFDEIYNALDNGTWVIVVHKTEPVFYRKVISINGTSGNFTLKTEYVDLTEIIPEGYLSTSTSLSTMKEVGNDEDSTKVVSRSIVLPTGEELPVAPDGSITLVFGSGSQTRASQAFSWSDSYNSTYGPIHFDSGNKTTFNGTLTLRPYVDLTLAWGMFSGLNRMYVKVGCDTRTKGHFEASYKKTFNKHKVWLTYKYKQTFTVYGIPIVVTEKIPIVYGIRGTGTGKSSDNASLSGNATIVFDGGVNPYFQFAYAGGTASARLVAVPYASLDAKVNFKANAFAYVGAEPSVAIYGVGLAMDNYVGPYGEIEAKLEGDVQGSLDLIDMDLDEIIESYNVTASLEGEVGLAYYGRVRAYSDWDTKIAKKIVNKVNEKIRGKYTEFWCPWPLYTVSKSYTSSHVKPGKLSVSGPSIINETLVGDMGYDHQFTYTLKNTGGQPIMWKVEVQNADPALEITVSPFSGSLHPNNSTSVNVSLHYDNNTITKASYVLASLHFIQYDMSCNKTSTKAFNPSVNTNFTPLTTQLYCETKNVQDKLTASITFLKVPNPAWDCGLEIFTRSLNNNLSLIMASWNQLPSGYGLKGYVIMYAKLSSCNLTDLTHVSDLTTAGNCPYRVLSVIEDANATSFMSNLNNLVKNGILESGQSYCFKIHAFDSSNGRRILFPPGGCGLTCTDIPLVETNPWDLTNPAYNPGEVVSPISEQND
ncbi:conserved hypothetical protein [Thermosulfidibacter takaii ABI70S6]|uniref:Uncharacterized protein n=1 Tax=Thermosulfidibacter takaii (strain DSM 17441 / JCM 13301 / NBRC 103674 / ABI70S6) TaxID=1298851 RepID=A0A0S3QTJ0_THET7|nr:hypothetical protein [Thermosulfidibacter takaii]BAT71642.1 conserved hypothetical protein [Thermosulfidibacter takaii ABI70S6]